MSAVKLCLFTSGSQDSFFQSNTASTVGLNEATVRKYIQEQEKHGIARDESKAIRFERGDGKGAKANCP